MKAFKGLKRNANGTLECRGFIYEPNKIFSEEDYYKSYEEAVKAAIKHCIKHYI